MPELAIGIVTASNKFEESLNNHENTHGKEWAATLPPQSTRLIGREQEVARIRNLLQSPIVNHQSSIVNP